MLYGANPDTSCAHFFRLTGIKGLHFKIGVKPLLFRFGSVTIAGQSPRMAYRTGKLRFPPSGNANHHGFVKLQGFGFNHVESLLFVTATRLNIKHHRFGTIIILSGI